MPLVVDAVPGSRLRFRLDGKLAEPTTARWKAASPAERASYWPVLATRLLVEWRGQMLAGRGRHGKVRRAKPVSRLLYKQSGEEHRGPGLLPRRQESRAWKHARVTPYADLGRVTGFFVSGTARFLSYHHTGTAGRGIPYFNDSGRLIGWRGLRGQVTGVVRDILPTATTISLAVASASARWARLIGKAPTTPVAPKPARKPAPKPRPIEPAPAPRPAPGPPPEPRPLDFIGQPTGEINDWQREQFDGWDAGLSADERRSLSDYGGNTYGSINTALRNGNMDRPGMAWAKPDVEAIDRAIDKGRTPIDLTVYRRIERLDDPVEAGGRLADPAFMSTSLEGNWLRDGSISGTRGALPQLWKIRVPAGTPTASMHDFGIGREAELLFGRDTSLRITGTRQGTDSIGRPLLYVDAVMEDPNRG